jgi:hypothetical protein
MEQSLITARSDHPPVLGLSGSQSPPWWVHWLKKEKLKQVIKNQTKGKKRSLEWERSRSPKARATLNTTKIKCSKIADSSRWGKRARHHRQKSTTKIQEKKSSQMHECKLPLNRCISPKISFLNAHPPGNMNWVLSSPLFVMQESSLQNKHVLLKYTKSTTTC